MDFQRPGDAQHFGYSWVNHQKALEDRTPGQATLCLQWAVVSAIFLAIDAAISAQVCNGDILFIPPQPSFAKNGQSWSCRRKASLLLCVLHPILYKLCRQKTPRQISFADDNTDASSKASLNLRHCQGIMFIWGQNMASSLGECASSNWICEAEARKLHLPFWHHIHWTR